MAVPNQQPKSSPILSCIFTAVIVLLLSLFSLLSYSLYRQGKRIAKLEAGISSPASGALSKEELTKIEDEILGDVLTEIQGNDEYKGEQGEKGDTGSDSLFISSVGNRNYTEANYVVDYETLTASINALDIVLKNIESGTTGLWIDAGSYIYPQNGGSTSLVVSDTGKVGIGTTSPVAALEALSTSEQLRLSYDSSNYTSFTVSPTGALAVNTNSGAGIVLGTSTTPDNLTVYGNVSATSTTERTMTDIQTGINDDLHTQTDIHLGNDGFARIVYKDPATSEIKFVKCGDVSCSSGNRTITTVATGIATGFSYSLAMALGTDGFARIAYRNNTANTLDFVHCTNDTCSTKTSTTIATGSVGRWQYNFLQLDSNNLAELIYANSDSEELIFARCTNNDCTTKTTTVVLSTAIEGYYLSFPSLALDQGGYARITGYKDGGFMNKWITHIQCTNSSCTSKNVNAIENFSGDVSSIYVGSDNYSRIIYRSFANLRFIQCTDASCSTRNINTAVALANTASMTPEVQIGSDGYPRIGYEHFGLHYIICRNSACSSVTERSLDTASAGTGGAFVLEHNPIYDIAHFAYTDYQTTDYTLKYYHYAEEMNGDLGIGDTLTVGGNTSLGTNSENTITLNAYINDDVYIGASSETLYNPGLSLGGNDLFVAGDTGIEGNLYSDTSISISSANTPTQTGYLTDNTYLDNLMYVVVVGNLAYYINHGTTDYFGVIDITDKVNPRLISHISHANINTPAHLYVDGKYAYITSYGNDRVTVVDVSDPKHPFIISTITDSTLLDCVRNVYMNGHYLYTADSCTGDAINIIDIADPYNPHIVGTVRDPRLDSIKISYTDGKYLYTTSVWSRMVTIIDVSNPSNPFVVGSLQNANLYDSQKLARYGNYLYVTTGTGNNKLSIIDIADPTNPSYVSYITFNNGWEVEVAGDRLYVSQYNNPTFSIYDISTPTSPTLLSTFRGGNYCNYFEIAGTYAYIVDAYNDTLRIVDLGGLKTPSAYIGSLSVGKADFSQDVTIDGLTTLTEGLSVGQPGIMSEGPLAVFTDTVFAQPALDLNLRNSLITSDVFQIDAAIDQSDYVYFYDGATYTNNTAEANSSGGTPFTILSDSSDYTYFGNANTFPSINFDLATVGTPETDVVLAPNGNAAASAIINTTEANLIEGTAFTLLSDTDDYLYFGTTSTFTNLYIDIATAGTGMTTAWQYWNGSAWTALTITGDETGSNNNGTNSFMSDGKISWTAPGNWATKSLTIGDFASQNNRYWIRVAASALTVAPTAYYASAQIPLKWEYYNGSAWSTIPTVYDDTHGLNRDGRISWSIPYNWTTNSVNSITSYWARLSVGFTNDGSEMTLGTVPTANIATISAMSGYFANFKSAGSSVFSVDASGNIIATGGLTVSGSLLPSGNDTYNLGSDGARWNDIFLGAGTIHIGTSASDEYTLSYDTGSDKLGFNYNATGDAEVVIDATGNMGIGTITPSGKLHILESGAKTAADYGLYLSNTATSGTASVNKYGLYISSTGVWNGTPAVNYGLYVDTPTGGTTNYAAIFAGGNVGIGTVTPARALDVSDTMRLEPRANAPTSPSAGDIYVDSTPDPDELCFYDGANWQGISSGTDANCQ